MQWNRDCKCKQTDICCVLLCRCTLGNSLIEKKFRGNGPGQYWHQRRREPEKPSGGIYNSVIGEGRANGGTALEFREYIIYEGKQVYPECEYGSCLCPSLSHLAQWFRPGLRIPHVGLDL